MTERSRKPIAALQLVVFVDLLGLTLVLPTLPFRAVELGGSGLWLGAVLAAYSAAQAVAAPLLGRLADRYGRRRLLLLSLFGSAASLLLMGIAGQLWTLLAARAVAGACGGSIAVAHAFAADVSGPKDRSRTMGRLGMAVGAAFTVGPLLGALASALGFTAAALAGSGVAVAALVIAWRLLPDAGGATIAEPVTATGARPRRPWALLAAAFAGMYALVGMESTVALLAGHRFGAGPGFVGVLLAVAGATMTLAQARPLAVAVQRCGDRAVAVAGAALMAVGLVALPMFNQPAFVAAVAIVAAGHGLLATTTMSLLSQAALPGRTGEVLGMGQSATALGRLVGPVAAGALYDLGPGLPFLSGAALAGLAMGAVGTAGLDATMPGGRTSQKGGS